VALRAGRAGLPGRRPRLTGDRLGVITHAVMSDVGLRQLHVLEEAGADPARVGRRPRGLLPGAGLLARDHGARVPASSSTSWACRSPAGAQGRAALIPLLLELLARGRADRVFLSQDVSHNEQLRLLRGKRLHVPPGDVLPRLRAGRSGGGRDPPDDRGETRAGSSRSADQPSRVASTESATLPCIIVEIGQPSRAASARDVKRAASIPGTTPLHRQRGGDHLQPAASLSKVTVAATFRRSGACRCGRGFRTTTSRSRKRAPRPPLLGAGPSIGFFYPRAQLTGSRVNDPLVT